MGRCHHCGYEMEDKTHPGCTLTERRLRGGMVIPRVVFGKERRYSSEVDLTGIDPEAAAKYREQMRALEDVLGPWPGEHKHCPDCGAPVDKQHHPGCDIEECGRCGLQVLSCECRPGDGREPAFVLVRPRQRRPIPDEPNQHRRPGDTPPGVPGKRSPR